MNTRLSKYWLHSISYILKKKRGPTVLPRNQLKRSLQIVPVQKQSKITFLQIAIERIWGPRPMKTNESYKSKTKRFFFQKVFNQRTLFEQIWLKVGYYYDRQAPEKATTKPRSRMHFAFNNLKINSYINYSFQKSREICC